MKLILQDYEPQQRPIAESQPQARTSVFRKTRVRLNPVVADARLFHAL